MEWSKLYGADSQPSFEYISKYINSGLWDELNSYLQEVYKIEPRSVTVKSLTLGT